MPGPRLRLTTTDHDCDVAGLTYVYAVRSRRAGGLSVGVNLSTNHACNWRCIYCQVPGLVRDASPAVDLERLERELADLLGRATRGELVEGAAEVKDVAICGNGEPTTSPDFPAVVDRVGAVLARAGSTAPLLLITNGSMLGRGAVRDAIARLATMRGEVWFKFDRATSAGMAEVNGTPTSPERHVERLRACARLCPTWIQSSFFTRKGEPPTAREVDAYVTALEALARDRVPVRGTLLYTVARPSLQPEGAELGPVSSDWMESLAARVRAAGFEARVSA